MPSAQTAQDHCQWKAFHSIELTEVLQRKQHFAMTEPDDAITAKVKIKVKVKVKYGPGAKRIAISMAL
jgi:chromosome condensin MukBEF ATPase and DNA-binding subunit MukB